MGHVFFVTPVPNGQLDQLAHWTLSWILQNEVQVDHTLYTCGSLDEAEASISIPLAHGIPPSLVILDHGTPDRRITEFGQKLRACVPETWIIDLVDNDSWLPSDTRQAFLVRKPVRREDWEDVLRHVFLRAPTPQWSRSQG